MRTAPVLRIQSLLPALAISLLCCDLHARVLVPGGSSTGATWDATPQVVLPAFPGGIHEFSDPIVDSAGNVTVVYARKLARGTGYDATIESIESVGSSGVWGAPQFIAQASTNSFIRLDLEVVIDADDEITLAWLVDDFVSGFAAELFTSRRVGGVWSAAQSITGSSSDVTSIELCLDADGDVVLCYDPDVSWMGSPEIWALVYEKDTSTWAFGGVLVGPGNPPPQPGGAYFGAFHTTLACTPDGSELFLGFLAANNGLYTRKWDANANTFDSAQIVPGSEDLQFQSSPDTRLALVAGGDGELTIFWEQVLGTNMFAQVASRTVAGIWTSPHVIAPVTSFSQGKVWTEGASPTSNADGDVLCAFAYQMPARTVLRVAEYDVVAGWKPEVDLGAVAATSVFNFRLTAGAAWLANDRAFVSFVTPNYDLRSFESNGLCWSGISEDVGGAFFSRFQRMAKSGTDVVLVYDRQANPSGAISSSEAIEATWHRGSQGVVPLAIGGLAGVANVPSLTADCELENGQPFSLSISNAAPSAPSFTFFGLGFSGAPTLGGILVPTPDVYLLRTTNPMGAFQFNFTVSGLPPGVSLWMQSWIVDPAAVQGFSATNAICAQTL